MAELKDSGARRNFDTGAVRDIAEDKGRCDLLPLAEVSNLLSDDTGIGFDEVLMHIDSYMMTGNKNKLLRAIEKFCSKAGWDIPTAILEVSKHYADGARKYSERNWEKGIPLHCYIDSGVRHYLKYLRGDTDEPHNRAFIWNILGALWTHRNKPELIDLPFKEKTSRTVEKIQEICSEKPYNRETCF